MTKAFLGVWVGHYDGLFDQFIRVEKTDSEIVAIKIEGDSFVPSGEITWKVDLKTGKAFGAVAEEGGRNLRFVDASIKVLAKDKVRVDWSCGLGYVIYRRDDI